MKIRDYYLAPTDENDIRVAGSQNQFLYVPIDISPDSVLLLDFEDAKKLLEALEGFLNTEGVKADATHQYLP